MDELSEDDKLIVARARKIQRFLSQPFYVAEAFTNFPASSSNSKTRSAASRRSSTANTTTCRSRPSTWSARSRTRWPRPRRWRRKRRKTMADKIAFDLVSPERLLLSDDADMVTVPGTEGYMGVMAGTCAGDLDAASRHDRRTGRRTGDRAFSSAAVSPKSTPQDHVLAEEAIPMAEMDLAVLDQRIARHRGGSRGRENRCGTARVAGKAGRSAAVRAVF